MTTQITLSALPVDRKDAECYLDIDLDLSDPKGNINWGKN